LIQNPTTMTGPKFFFWNISDCLHLSNYQHPLL
jgi:hypothetical protein